MMPILTSRIYNDTPPLPNVISKPFCLVSRDKKNLVFSLCVIIIIILPVNEEIVNPNILSVFLNLSNAWARIYI